MGRAGLPHRALSAAPRHAVQHRRGVPHLDPCARRAMSRSYRAELEHTYRDAHPAMNDAAGDDGPRAALAGRRPRSGPALAQGPRGAARRRRASDAAIAGAGRLHGDRGRALPRRADPCGRRRLRGGLPPVRGRAAVCAPRACSWNPARSGSSTTPKASRGTCATRLRRRGTRSTCSIASPGSTTGSRSRGDARRRVIAFRVAA